MDGAAGFAIPTRYGQSLRVQETDSDSRLDWSSFDEENRCWFRGSFDTGSLEILDSSDQKVATTLSGILKASREINAEFLAKGLSYSCETSLNFPRNWGLGSSSTLINNIASWAEVNPYQLLQNTMGGSGYDIACAGINQPLIYRRNAFSPIIDQISYAPSFADQLYFIHLGNKQDSREGINKYRSVSKSKESAIWELDALTERFIAAETLQQLNAVIKTHEALISKFLEIECVKERLFPDFWGEIKSLGAWGGDFVLVSSDRNPQDTSHYFHQKGYPDVIRFNDMIFA